MDDKTLHILIYVSAIAVIVAVGLFAWFGGNKKD